MKSREQNPTLYFRVLDANVNRLNEGIRVLEDTFRYIYENLSIASKLKELRHTIRPSFYADTIQCRDADADILKPSTDSELNKKNIRDIVIANFKRTQEAARVLEEFCKIDYQAESQAFKNIRYTLYTLEKEALPFLKS